MFNYLWRYMRNVFRRCAWPVLRTCLVGKFWLLGPYYAGLGAQARHLYRTSDLFRYRWEALGYDYAMESFDGDAFHFFCKAKQENWQIRLQIFVDATFGRKPRAYYLYDEGEF